MCPVLKITPINGLVGKHVKVLLISHPLQHLVGRFDLRSDPDSELVRTLDANCDPA